MRGNERARNTHCKLIHIGNCNQYVKVILQYRAESNPNKWIMKSGSTSHKRIKKSIKINIVPWEAPITRLNKEAILQRDERDTSRAT
jgi:hypothetical protein